MNIFKTVGAISVLFVVVFSYAGEVSANPVLRIDETVSLQKQQVVNGDFYAAGSRVLITGEVEGDAHAVGTTIEIAGSVDADVFAVGARVDIEGAVADDARIIAGDAIISGSVEGDLVVFARTLTVRSDAEITGDILFTGAEVIMEGSVEGSVFGTADTIRINGSVGGSLDVTAYSSLSLGTESEILGDIVYHGNKEIERAASAVVVGTIQSEQMVAEPETYNDLIFLVLMLLFGALTLYLISRSSLKYCVEDLEEHYGSRGLIGLAGVIGIPIVSLLLLLSTLGFIVGMILLMLYFALLFTVLIASVSVLGSLLLRRVWNGRELDILAVFVGTLGVIILMLIPYLGPLLLFMLFMMVAGSLLLRAYRCIGK